MSDDLFKEEFKRFRNSRGEFAAGEVIDFENVEPSGASQVTNNVISNYIFVYIWASLLCCSLVCRICLPRLCRHARLLKDLGYCPQING